MRVNYQSTEGDGYAIAKQGESRISAVGRSIARRIGYHYRSAAVDSWDAGGAFTTYQLILTQRRPRYSGDAVPFRNVWVTVYN